MALAIELHSPLKGRSYFEYLTALAHGGLPPEHPFSVESFIDQSNALPAELDVKTRQLSTHHVVAEELLMTIMKGKEMPVFYTTGGSEYLPSSSAEFAHRIILPWLRALPLGTTRWLGPLVLNEWDPTWAQQFVQWIDDGPKSELSPGELAARAHLITWLTHVLPADPTDEPAGDIKGSALSLYHSDKDSAMAILQQLESNAEQVRVQLQGATAGRCGADATARQVAAAGASYDRQVPLLMQYTRTTCDVMKVLGTPCGETPGRFLPSVSETLADDLRAVVKTIPGLEPLFPKHQPLDIPADAISANVRAALHMVAHVCLQGIITQCTFEVYKQGGVPLHALSELDVLNQGFYDTLQQLLGDVATTKRVADAAVTAAGAGRIAELVGMPPMVAAVGVAALEATNAVHDIGQGLHAWLRYDKTESSTLQRLSPLLRQMEELAKAGLPPIVNDGMGHAIHLHPFAVGFLGDSQISNAPLSQLLAPPPADRLQGVDTTAPGGIGTADVLSPDSLLRLSTYMPEMQLRVLLEKWLLELFYDMYFIKRRQKMDQDVVQAMGRDLSSRVVRATASAQLETTTLFNSVIRAIKGVTTDPKEANHHLAGLLTVNSNPFIDMVVRIAVMPGFATTHVSLELLEKMRGVLTRPGTMFAVTTALYELDRLGPAASPTEGLLTSSTTVINRANAAGNYARFLAAAKYYMQAMEVVNPDKSVEEKVMEVCLSDRTRYTNEDLQDIVTRTCQLLTTDPLGIKLLPTLATFDAFPTAADRTAGTKFWPKETPPDHGVVYRPDMTDGVAIQWLAVNGPFTKTESEWLSVHPSHSHIPEPSLAALPMIRDEPVELQRQEEVPSADTPRPTVAAALSVADAPTAEPVPSTRRSMSKTRFSAPRVASQPRAISREGVPSNVTTPAHMGRPAPASETSAAQALPRLTAEFARFSALEPTRLPALGATDAPTTEPRAITRENTLFNITMPASPGQPLQAEPTPAHTTTAVAIPLHRPVTSASTHDRFSTAGAADAEPADAPDQSVVLGLLAGEMATHYNYVTLLRGVTAAAHLKICMDRFMDASIVDVHGLATAATSFVIFSGYARRVARAMRRHCILTPAVLAASVYPFTGMSFLGTAISSTWESIFYRAGIESGAGALRFLAGAPAGGLSLTGMAVQLAIELIVAPAALSVLAMQTNDPFVRNSMFGFMARASEEELDELAGKGYRPARRPKTRGCFGRAFMGFARATGRGLQQTARVVSVAAAPPVAVARAGTKLVASVARAGLGIWTKAHALTSRGVQRLRQRGIALRTNRAAFYYPGAINVLLPAPPYLTKSHVAALVVIESADSVEFDSDEVCASVAWIQRAAVDLGSYLNVYTARTGAPEPAIFPWSSDFVYTYTCVRDPREPRVPDDYEAADCFAFSVAKGREVDLYVASARDACPDDIVNIQLTANMSLTGQRGDGCMFGLRVRDEVHDIAPQQRYSMAPISFGLCNMDLKNDAHHVGFRQFQSYAALSANHQARQLAYAYTAGLPSSLPSIDYASLLSKGLLIARDILVIGLVLYSGSYNGVFEPAALATATYIVTTDRDCARSAFDQLCVDLHLKPNQALTQDRRARLSGLLLRLLISVLTNNMQTIHMASDMKGLERCKPPHEWFTEFDEASATDPLALQESRTFIAEGLVFYLPDILIKVVQIAIPATRLCSPNEIIAYMQGHLICKVLGYLSGEHTRYSQFIDHTLPPPPHGSVEYEKALLSSAGMQLGSCLAEHVYLKTKAVVSHEAGDDDMKIVDDRLQQIHEILRLIFGWCTVHGSAREQLAILASGILGGRAVEALHSADLIQEMYANRDPRDVQVVLSAVTTGSKRDVLRRMEKHVRAVLERACLRTRAR